jgi:cytochrome P450
MLEAVLLLATIARRFRLELLPGQTLKLVPSVTMRPRNGIKIVVRERTPLGAALRERPAAASAQYATN